MEEPANLSIQDLAEVLTVVILEVVAASSPDSAKARERMEDIGSRLLDTANGLIVDSPPRQLIRALAEQLIKIES